MIRKFLTTLLLLTGSLSVSACVPSGDFCDVVTSPIQFDKDTATAVVASDRGEAEQIATINAWGSNH